MASGTMSSVVRGLERLFGAGGVTGLTEGQLLDRFVSHHDPAAFEAIVVRHGPMVRGVCKRLLKDSNDVDDAFQATFLVLAKKASTLRRRELLGNWLYGVAYKVANRARVNAARRHASETPSEGVGELAVTCELRDDDAPTLHEEVHRLPEKYRVAVVLCYLEGMTHEEAAERLSWPVGTVKGRLSRARDMLRSRLIRRGVSLGSVPLVEALSLDARVLVPQALVESTVKAAALAAAGKTALATGLITAEAYALSEGAMHAMFLTKLKAGIATLAVAGTLTTGAGVYAYQTQDKPGGGPAGSAAAAPSVNPPIADVRKTLDAAKPPVAMPSGPADPFKKPLNEMVEEQKKDFNRILDAQRQWQPGMVSNMIQQSQDLMETLLIFHPEPDAMPIAHKAHEDRLKLLYEKVQQVETFDRASMLKEVARAYKEAQDAEGDNDVQVISAPRTLYRPSGGPPPSAVPEGVVVAPPTPNPPGQPVPDSQPNLLPTANPPLAQPSPMIAPVPASTPGPGASRVAGGGFGGGGFAEATLEEIEEKNKIRVLIAELSTKITGEDKTPATVEIVKKLGMPIAMPFASETALQDVLKYIKEATKTQKDNGIPIYIDPVGLQDADKTATSTVILDLEGVPLKTSLRLVLKQLGLAYCVKDGLLMISSPQGILNELRESESATTEPNKRIGHPGGMMGGAGGGMR